jgi:hypothetical protein
MLLKFEAHDIAWLAADRALHTALAADDTWSLARATRSVARAMTSSQHGSGRALEFATTIDPVAVTALPAERRANYLLDLTEAHSRTGHFPQAAQCLLDAEQVAPEEVRCRPLAHGLLRSLLDKTSGQSARLVRDMATRAGVTA